MSEKIPLKSARKNGGYIQLGEDLLKEYPDKYIVPTSKQIFIDIDDDEQYESHSARLGMMQDFFEDNAMTFTCEVYPSKSGLPHRHIIITFEEDLNVPEKLFLQSFLMSDLKRDIMSFIQYREGDMNPIILEKVGDRKNG